MITITVLPIDLQKYTALTKALLLMYSIFRPFIFRLEFFEHFDYKQDKTLSSVRLVCKNATKVLKRKDSSGSILKDGLVQRSDFR